MDACFVCVVDRLCACVSSGLYLGPKRENLSVGVARHGEQVLYLYFTPDNSISHCYSLLRLIKE